MNSQAFQKVSHDKRAKSRSFTLEDIVYARSYGQGPAWEKGTIVDNSGPHNFSVDITHAGQLMTWRRHVNQLKKCFDDITVSHKEQELTDASSIPEGEEEDSSTSGVTEVWSNSNSSEVFEHSTPNVTPPSTASDNLPRRNPPRNRKPPDRLT